MSAVGGTGHGSGRVLVKPPFNSPDGGGEKRSLIADLIRNLLRNNKNTEGPRYRGNL